VILENEAKLTNLGSGNLLPFQSDGNVSSNNEFDPNEVILSKSGLGYSQPRSSLDDSVSSHPLDPSNSGVYHVGIDANANFKVIQQREEAPPILENENELPSSYA